MKKCNYTFLILLFFCCSSDSETTTPNENPIEENFYALTVGNSWVYRTYVYNTDEEQYEESEILDSVSIVGMETISNKTFYKFRIFTTGNDLGLTLSNPNGEQFEYLREEDGNLINENNEIKFSNNNYTERIVIHDESWGTLYERLVEGAFEVEVPAGVFICMQTQRYARNLLDEPMPSLDRIYYSEEVGLIFDSISFLAFETPLVIRKLVTYDIQ